MSLEELKKAEEMAFNLHSFLAKIIIRLQAQQAVLAEKEPGSSVGGEE